MKGEPIVNIYEKKNREDYIQLIPELKEWLGEAGLMFFRNVKKEHGTLNACIKDDGNIPHPVHFREGMQVRNKVRDMTNNTWSYYEYSNTWIDIIEECMKC